MMGFVEIALRKFVTLVEIDPPKGNELADVMKIIDVVVRGKLDGVTISDNPMSKMRVSSLGLASWILFAQAYDQEFGIKKSNFHVIPHLTCRDRNVLALQSELLGASLFGVKNVLALTGDPCSIGEYQSLKGVFDVNSKDLVRIISLMNAGLDALGKPIKGKTDFGIGVAFNPLGGEEELEKLKAKLDQGAGFVLTQPLIMIDAVEKLREMVKNLAVPIIVGVMPLISDKMAIAVSNIPGIIVPDEILSLICSKSREQQWSIGIDIQKRLLVEIKKYFQGVYVVCPFGGGVERLERMLKELGLWGS